MIVGYHPTKANVVPDALTRLYMESVAYIEDDKKDLIEDIQSLARWCIQLVDSTKSGVLVHKG